MCILLSLSWRLEHCVSNDEDFFGKGGAFNELNRIFNRREVVRGVGCLSRFVCSHDAAHGVSVASQLCAYIAMSRVAASLE